MATAQVFSFERAEHEQPKKIVRLCRGDLVFSAVQVLRSGGENILHSHQHLEGFWFVLSGRFRFYTTEDAVLADLGPHQGVLIPRDYPYWFESVGDGPHELLQVEASDRLIVDEKSLAEGRTDYAERRVAVEDLMRDTPT